METASAAAEDELRSTESYRSAVTIFDRGGAAPVTSVPPIGLAPRRKSRRRRPVLMFVEFVGGGFLGIAIGYAILMWLFDKDPLQIAPRLPGFMVPAAMRTAGLERVAGSPEKDDANADAASSAGSPGDDNSKQSSPGNELPSLERLSEPDPARSNVEPFAAPTIDPLDAKDERSKAPPSGATVQKRDPLVELVGGVSDSETKVEANEPLRNPFEAAATDARPTTESPVADRGESPAVLPEAADVLGPVSEKRFTREELLAAVAAAKTTTERAIALPVDATPAQRKKVHGPFYVNLCMIAEALTFLERSADREQDDKATTAAIEAILNAVPDQHRLEEVGKLTGYWYDRPQGKGIVLAGIVKQSNQQGNLVESVVETLGPPRRITVVSPSALIEDSSRPVLVVGSIVKDATKNLPGYQGPAETVVWAEMVIDPSAPARGRSGP
jgi:hypothetical protein